MSDHAPPAAETNPAPAAKPGAILTGFLVLVFGMILILFNAGIEMPTIIPEGISTYADSVDLLFDVVLWIVLFFFVLTQALLIYFIVKYRADGQDPGKAKHMHGSHTLELFWTFIPGMILFLLAVFQTGTWGDIKFQSGLPTEDEDPLHVQVFGAQFQWDFRYAGRDGEFGTADDIAKTGVLRVPAERKVVIHLQTRDVLHSFWLPNVRLKQDLLPGQTIQQWFEILPRAEYPATYPVVCAELCGNLHTTMKGELVVYEKSAFDQWLAEEGAKRADNPHIPADDPNWKFWRDYR